MKVENIVYLIGALFGVNEQERAAKVLHSDKAQWVGEVTEEILYTLSPREETVIKMLFGLGPSGDMHTFAEVAEHFTLPTQRLREIESKALRKLRHPARAALIKKFLSELERRQLQDERPAELIPVVETIQKLTPSLIAHLQRHEDDLNKIHWRVFEHLIAEFFASWGFKDVQLVGRNSMTSADIFATYVVNPLGVKHRYFIEVKRWKRKIGIEVINQVLGAMISERERFGWHAAMIVTQVGYKDFEKWDREELAMKGIELKDRDDLLGWLRGYKQNESGLWLPEISEQASSGLLGNAQNSTGFLKGK
jgi:restriction endonuclease Mrr